MSVSREEKVREDSFHRIYFFHQSFFPSPLLTYFHCSYVSTHTVANRIICVGDLNRAQLYADLFLDRDHKVFRYLSSRGFLTLTGRYKGVPVSIIGTGMGCAMIDFTIREVCAVVDGDICMIRTGTCGTLDANIQPGHVVVNDSSVMTHRNPDAFRSKNSGRSDLEPYLISEPVYADSKLTSLLHDCMVEEIGNASEDIDKVHIGMNSTGDSFYSSQGRIGEYFDDRNENLFDMLRQKRPEVKTIEMETFHLFDMAECARKNKMYASSALIVLAQRNADKFIDLDLKHQRERQAGRASLEAVIRFEMQNTHADDNSVWVTK